MGVTLAQLAGDDLPEYAGGISILVAGCKWEVDSPSRGDVSLVTSGA
jgi:hypothetical protein